MRGLAGEQTLGKRLEGEHRVQSAKGERVGEAGLNLCLSRLVGDHVQVARGIGAEEIRGRGQHSVFEGENAGNRLQRTGCAESMTMHGFG